jgi:hypothetical protein
MPAARRLVPLGALTLVGVVVHGPPALAVAPCATAKDSCVVTPPTSAAQWTTVPGEQNGLEGQAFSQVLCPGSSRIGGADWSAPANNQLNVDLSLFQDGWPSPVGTFYATNSSTQPSAFAAFVGCVSGSSSSRHLAAAAASGVKHRVKILRVRPRTRVTASSSCRRGERRLRAGAAVVFDSRPTRAELRDHDYRYTVRPHGVRVMLSAGRTVGDDERVTLQVHAVCRRVRR